MRRLIPPVGARDSASRGSVDADTEARAEHRASPDEDAGDEPCEERGDLAALEAADFLCHWTGSFRSLNGRFT